MLGQIFFRVCSPTIALDAHNPRLMNDRLHWNFIKQSLVEMNNDLAAFNSKILTVNTEVVTAFNQLQNFYTINTVFV